jgi:hypothetical protein
MKEFWSILLGLLMGTAISIFRLRRKWRREEEAALAKPGAAMRAVREAAIQTSPVRAFAASARVPDPGKQALEILQRGENCDWYSIQHTDEQHEAFDCLEIYWRTNVEHPERNELRYGRGPFELKAGFRVRWHVAATRHSYVEAVGLDLMTTILEARERADALCARMAEEKAMGSEHPILEEWKRAGPGRSYTWHGLDVDQWYVRVDFPGGTCWTKHPKLDHAVLNVLAKARAIAAAEAPSP